MEDNFLLDMLKNQYKEEVLLEILTGLSQKRKTTLRVNTLKTSNKEIEEVFQKENIIFEKSIISENAYVLENDKEETIKQLDIYEEGKIYLQSLSSMLPPIILEPKENADILDMTAAPGGKTTQIAAITDNKAHITACEMNPIRAERLKYNVEKQGATSIYCMVKDARQIDNFFSFDQILLDAPCSGSGTLSINENIDQTFTEKLVQKSIKAQIALISKAINILKPGGTLVYSTCSILSCENEEVVEKALKSNKLELIPIQNNFVKNLPLLPTKIPGTLCICPTEFFEGFFVAKFKKL